MSEASSLLELQDLDLLCSKLVKKAESLPQKEQVSKIRSNVKLLTSKLNTIVGVRKDIEIELDELEVHQKYVQDKTTEVQNTQSSNYRETQNLETSLSTLAKKREKIEFQMVELQNRLEQARKAEANARSALQKLQEDEQDAMLSFKLALEEIRKELQAATLKREQTASELPEDLLNQYEAARKRFNGVAVENLVGNRPSACRVTLQTSSYTELRRSGREINTCPYCKRMLVTSFLDE